MTQNTGTENTGKPDGTAGTPAIPDLLTELLEAIGPRSLYGRIADQMEGVGAAPAAVDLRLHMRPDAHAALTACPAIGAFLCDSVRAAAERLLAGRQASVGGVTLEAAAGQRSLLLVVPLAQHADASAGAAPPATAPGALYLLSGDDRGQALWLDSGQTPRPPRPDEVAGEWPGIEGLRRLVQSGVGTSESGIWAVGQTQRFRGELVIYQTL